MPGETKISQRDLRLHSKEIMDAVERGDTFLVTRDGRGIGQLIPLRRRERFVARADFVSSSAVAATVSLERFRNDQNELFRGTVDDPYAR
jgi:prevent-host-death family protein